MSKIFEKVRYEDVEVVKKEYVNYYPYSTTKYDFHDVIRIPANADSFLVMPSESYVYIRGTVQSALDNSNFEIPVNPFAYLFESIALYVNNKKVDSCKNVGITSTMLAYARLSKEDVGGSAFAFGSAAGFFSKGGNFCVAYPLKHVLGFADTYQKPVVCSDLTLELLRARNNEGFYKMKVAGRGVRSVGGDGPPTGDDDEMMDTHENVRAKRDDTDAKFMLEIKDIWWSMPRITLNDMRKLEIMKKINTNALITIPYRSFDTYDMKLPPNCTRTTWQITSVPLDEQPNWVLIALQQERKPKPVQSHSKFDQCGLRSFQFNVNQTSFPPARAEVNWQTNDCAAMYNNYLRFKSEYYDNVITVGGGIHNGPYLTLAEWIDSPIYVLPLSRDFGEIANRSSASLSLELEAQEKFPEDTVVYVVLVQDKLVDYHPISKLVYSE